MARTRNISIGVSAELHARYAKLGLAERRAVLAEIRRLLARRLQGAGSDGEQGGGAAAAHLSQARPAASPPELGSTESTREGGLQDAGLALPLGW